MRIGIMGHGKMGHAVARQAVERGHTTVILSLPDPLIDGALEGVDCVIDFSDASVADSAIHACLDTGKAVVSGTTGWNFDRDRANEYCQQRSTAFCWAPNFSVGMHMTFHLNKVLAKMMNKVGGYVPSILEVHHTEKRDSPSGTAIALADAIVAETTNLNSWHVQSEGVPSEDSLVIDARREEDVKGIHRVVYTGATDTISLRHHALSRDGFALGAIVAAEKLTGRIGYYDFEALLDF